MKSSLWLFALMWMFITPWASAAISDAFLQENDERLEKVFSSIDASMPGLEIIIYKWETGDKKPAAEMLVRYFRGKSFDLSILEPAYIPDDFTERADAALNDSYYIHGDWITVPKSTHGGFNWDYRGQSEDKEIAWTLNRHTIFPILQHAYTHSRREPWKKLLNHLCTDWIENSPYPNRITFSAQWRPLEVARRVLNSWVHVFYGDTAILNDETILLMLSSIPDHADSLYQHASFWGGNHLLTEKIALLAIAAAWPEFQHSQEWKADAMEAVTRQLLKQSYPDGSYKELSNHYQRVILANTLPFLRLIEYSDPRFRQSPVYERIELMWDFFAGSMNPGGFGPLSNASDQDENSVLMLSAWKHFNRLDWLGMASHGRKGILPQGNPSRYFPWAGQVFMRNNWSQAADWIYFDAGPYGTAHQHIDRLHLSITLQGKPILSDSGRYTYQPGKWREYFKGPRAHSVLLLDGQASKQGPCDVKAPMDVAFQDLDQVIYSSATTSFHPAGEPFRSPVPWTRHVLYDKRGFAVILDELQVFKEYNVEALWQFAPGISPEEAQSAVRAHIPALIEKQQIENGREKDPIAGFYSPNYSQKVPSVQISNSFSIKSPTTIIHSIQHPESNPITILSPQSSDSGEIHFTVHQDGKMIARGRIAAYPKTGLLDYSGFPTN
ncbi:MAG: heparinase II/III family protein [Cephaloticoccus sp.]|nr:heparinase II/III family protein [Cephaloticoccus sp.]